MAENDENEPSKSKKRRLYYAWNETSMALALEALKSKKIGLNAAARSYGVPKATLHRRLMAANKKAKDAIQIVGSGADLTPEVESVMVEHILEMESILYGYTPKDVRMLAFRYAEKLGIKHRFNKNKEIAGKKWFYNFMKRHPELSLRQPRATSFNRATAFNKEMVNDFFNKLIEITEKHNINEARHVYNVDESGLTTVQRKTRKILAKKGKHQVGSITSGERGVTTTVVCCANAAGQLIPPLIIFKRQNAKDELRDGAPPGSIFAYNPESGFITKDIFYVWMQHFIEQVKPSPEKKVLLILDGHVTHTKHLPSIELARKHGIVLLSLPGHTSNKLQPLDVSFYRPLSAYYIDETEKWLRQNPGRVVTQYQISMLFGKAYERAGSVGNIVNGFRKTGIYPINRDVFQDYEFVPVQEECSVPTGRTLSPVLSPEQEIDNLITRNSSDPLDIRCCTTQPNNNIQTQTSPLPPQSDSSYQTAISPKPSTSKIIEQISPGAKLVAQQLKKTSRRTQKATELTSSPYKQNLEETQTKKLKKGFKPRMKMESKVTMRKTSDIREWFCKICAVCEMEEMIQCLLCKEWVHVTCGGAKKAQKKYFCPTCTN